MYFIPCFRVSQDALRKIACSCLVSSPDVPIGTICPSSVANKPQDSADSSECLQVLSIWGKGAPGWEEGHSNTGFCFIMKQLNWFEKWFISVFCLLLQKRMGLKWVADTLPVSFFFVRFFFWNCANMLTQIYPNDLEVKKKKNRTMIEAATYV